MKRKTEKKIKKNNSTANPYFDPKCCNNGRSISIPSSLLLWKSHSILDKCHRLHWNTCNSKFEVTELT